MAAVTSGIARTVRPSRRSPIANRARAWNHFGHATWALARARRALDAQDRAGATFWVGKALEAHHRGRAYQKRLAGQGGGSVR